MHNLFPRWLVITAVLAGGLFLVAESVPRLMTAWQEARKSKMEADAMEENVNKYVPPPRERRWDRLDLSGCLPTQPAQPPSKCP